MYCSFDWSHPVDRWILTLVNKLHAILSVLCCAETVMKAYGAWYMNDSNGQVNCPGYYCDKFRKPRKDMGLMGQNVNQTTLQWTKKTEYIREELLQVTLLDGYGPRVFFNPSCQVVSLPSNTRQACWLRQSEQAPPSNSTEKFIIVPRGVFSIHDWYHHQTRRQRPEPRRGYTRSSAWAATGGATTYGCCCC